MVSNSASSQPPVSRRGKFTLSDIDDYAAHSLGQRFAAEFNPHHVAVDVDESRPVASHEDLSAQLSSDVSGLVLVPQERKERSGAKRLVSSFLNGAGISVNSDTVAWSEEHSIAAVDSFQTMIRERFQSRPAAG